MEPSKNSGRKPSVTKVVPLTDDQKVERLAAGVAGISSQEIRELVIGDLNDFVERGRALPSMREETRRILRHAELTGLGANARFRPCKTHVQSLVRRRWNEIIPSRPSPKDRAIGTVFASGRGR